jgi:YHS domain-containing protein
MRAIHFVVLVALVVLILVMLLRPRSAAPPATRALRDELVKDPVCQTYVVRAEAVSRPGVDGPRYFCSAECARRYAAETRG